MQKYLFIIVALIIICLPFLNMVIGFTDELPLTGVTYTTETPTLSLDSWFSSEFAQNCNAWIDTKMGFRSYMIKSYAQIDYSVFHKASQKFENGTDVTIAVGKDGCLYGKSSYDAVYFVRNDQRKNVAKTAQMIKEIQDKFASEGIAFYVISPPNKARMLPEYLQTRYTILGNTPYDAYDEYLAAFENIGVNYVDVQQILLNLKEKNDKPIYAVGGTHWTEFSAFYTFQEFAQNLSRDIDVELPANTPTFVPSDQPVGQQADLLNHLNIWYNDFGYEYYDITIPPYKPQVPLKLSINGDSFGHEFMAIAVKSGFFTEISHLYYLNWINKYTESQGFVPYVPTEITNDPQRYYDEMFSSDIVVYLYVDYQLEPYIHKMYDIVMNHSEAASVK